MKLFKSDSYLRTKIAENCISTPLGKINFNVCFKSDDVSMMPFTEAYDSPGRGQILCWHTESFDAEMMITSYKPELPKGMNVDACYGVVWKVKSKTEAMSCRFSSIWEDGFSWREFGRESGENLECQSWENSSIKVSIGTPESIDPNSIVEYFDKGLTILMNSIRKNEVYQIHFVVAWSKNVQHDTSSWFAVDAHPSALMAAGDVW